MGSDVGRITTSEGQVGPLPSGTFPPDVGPGGSATRLRKVTPMQGFKDFLFRGNLIELAVAFIIGGAFATVVKGFTEIIFEILTKAVGNVSFDKWAPGGFTTVGPFLTGLVSFVILAVVVYFALVKPYEAVSARLKKPAAEAPIVPTTEDLLIEIRDLLAAQK
jgi:large conductance mechanosensitive channel